MSEDTQHEVLAHLIDHVCEHGFQPTVAEMAEHFGVTPRAVRDRLDHLVRKGYLAAPVKRMERCWSINREGDERNTMKSWCGREHTSPLVVSAR